MSIQIQVSKINDIHIPYSFCKVSAVFFTSTFNSNIDKFSLK